MTVRTADRIARHLRKFRSPAASDHGIDLARELVAADLDLLFAGPHLCRPGPSIICAPRRVLPDPAAGQCHNAHHDPIRTAYGRIPRVAAATPHGRNRDPGKLQGWALPISEIVEPPHAVHWPIMNVGAVARIARLLDRQGNPGSYGRGAAQRFWQSLKYPETH